MFKLFQKKINEASIEDVYVDLGNDEHVLLKDALDKYEELRNADAEAEAKANRKVANADDEVSLHDGSKVKISDIVARINKCNEEAKEEEETKANSCKNEEEKPEEKEEEKENSEAEEDEKENSEEEAKEEDKENSDGEEKSEEEDKENSEDEEKEEDKENEAEDEEEEKKEDKKKNSSELRKAFLNSGLSKTLEEDKNFQKGKDIINGFEKARQMGI